eukprot:scaffold4061_cov108-Cylindrotheca_fusiformis.AAC.9
MCNGESGDEEERRAFQVNELILSESSTMTASRRHKVLLEVHGFHPPIHAPSDTDLDALVDQVRKQASVVRKRKAYNKALFLNRRYADSRNFLLMFLRAENYSPLRAAQQLVLHFETKLELFGIDKLTKKITYEDLNDDDRSALSTGALQFLSEKDNSGRPVLLESFEMLEYHNVQNQLNNYAFAEQLRATWYLLMSVIEDDISVQQEGMVRVMYNLDYSKSELHLDLIQKSSIIFDSVPTKFMGLHFCYNNENLRPMLTAVQLAAGIEGRSRLRDHFGTPNHVSASLEKYNIPASTLAAKTSHTSTDARESIGKYLDRIKKEEKQDRIKGRGSSVQPMSTDVILGRGRHQQEYPGNLELAKLVDSKRQEYSSARKLDKSRIIREVAELFEESGGRFLERHERAGKVMWIEANSEARREKVSQLFRTQTKRNSEYFGSS